jgi:hypothetical protein
MLFAIRYHLQSDRSRQEWREARSTFLEWSPPDGVEIRHHFHFLSNDGVVIVDADSAELLYKGVLPFRPTDIIDIEPVVNLYEALALSLEHEETQVGNGRNPAQRKRSA